MSDLDTTTNFSSLMKIKANTYKSQRSSQKRFLKLIFLLQLAQDLSIIFALQSRQYVKLELVTATGLLFPDHH